MVSKMAAIAGFVMKAIKRCASRDRTRLTAYCCAMNKAVEAFYQHLIALNKEMDGNGSFKVDSNGATPVMKNAYELTTSKIVGEVGAIAQMLAFMNANLCSAK